MLDLKQTITLCINEDRRAQKALFEYLSPKLLSVSRRYCLRGMEPVDVMQDAFIKIFSHLHQYRSDKGSFDAWAKKIVINTALDRLKEQKRKIDPMALSIIDKEDDINLLADLHLEDLMKVIEKLPDGYKQVFCLHEIEGYKYSEIAEMLNIQEVSCRSQLFRSKKILKEILIQLNFNITDNNIKLSHNG